MKYLEAISKISHDHLSTDPFVFMAGGITGCPDWQQEIRRMLEGTQIGTLLNPRRSNFPINDASAAETQIRWEAECLEKADAILFWFCSETIQPIVLYELGAWSMTDKPIFVGVHPNYARKQDVMIQTSIKRPDVVIVDSLEHLAQQVKDYLAR